MTSTYLEGEHNALAAFGYNRDRRSGKRQIVIGLLRDADGRPLSIEASSRQHVQRHNLRLPELNPG